MLNLKRLRPMLLASLPSAMLMACGRSPNPGDTSATSGENEASQEAADESAEEFAEEEAEAEDDAQAEGEAETGPLETTTGGVDLPDGPPPLVEDCMAACESRLALVETGGFCEFDFMQGQSCQAWCEVEFDPLDTETYVAGTQCIGDDPLCFQSLEMCICSKLTGNPEC